MPKINRDFIKSVFFLYKDKESATAGVDAEGTGFIVEYYQRYFAVTNRHVARDVGASIIRLNKHDGGTENFEFSPDDWETFSDRGDDIAVHPIELDRKIHDVSAISQSLLLTEDQSKYEIGVGDDVFMIGLFVDREGRDRNNPLARFGNISMMADKNSPLEANGREVEGFIVDMHSRTGFSGSPVFVYRTFGGDLANSSYGHKVKIRASDLMPRAVFPGLSETRSHVDVELKSDLVLHLIGIHWAQFNERWEVKEMTPEAIEARAQFAISEEKHYIKGVSGMTCVAPAWKILELIEMVAKKTKLPQTPKRRELDESQLESRENEITGDEILRRMLNTPPDPKKAH